MGDDSAVYYSEPLQLVSIDAYGKCRVQEEAAAVLGQLRGKLAVVGIAGLYRTGKSFLLNRLLGMQDGFEIGPTVNPCTKGLWIWGQPMQLGPDYHCIFMDTEGLGSAQRTTSCDMQIFTLCVLLSSYFIYNSMGAIDELALDDLHLVLHLAKRIHASSTAGGMNALTDSEIAQYFPSFLWVLRDFHLQMIDDNGVGMTEKEYLEDALKPLPGQEERNKLRSVVKDLFRDRDCATMVRPVADEGELRNVNKLKFECLRPQFQKEADAFTRKVYSSVRPKRIDGNPVSGAMLVELLQEYCKAMNNSAIPAIRSTWASVVQSQMQRCLKSAVQAYRSQMNERAMKHLPMPEDQLHELHRAAKAQAYKVLTEPNFPEDDPTFREYQAELSRRITQLFEHVKAENTITSHAECQRLAEELYDRFVYSKFSVQGRYRSVDELMQDWEQVRRIYLQRTSGLAQQDVLNRWLLPTMSETVERLTEMLRKEREKSSRGRMCNLGTLMTGFF